MLRSKGGFTLIELIMIIVILGILAAIAIPKYQDLANDARQAVVDGAAGALKSAAVITYAKNRGAKSSLATIAGQVNWDTTASINTGTSTCSAAVVFHTENASIIKQVDIGEYCS